MGLAPWSQTQPLAHAPSSQRIRMGFQDIAEASTKSAAQWTTALLTEHLVSTSDEKEEKSPARRLPICPAGVENHP